MFRVHASPNLATRSVTRQRPSVVPAA
jgi:hypothetical protein